MFGFSKAKPRHGEAGVQEIVKKHKSAGSVPSGNKAYAPVNNVTMHWFHPHVDAKPHEHAAFHADMAKHHLAHHDLTEDNGQKAMHKLAASHHLGEVTTHLSHPSVTSKKGVGLSQDDRTDEVMNEKVELLVPADEAMADELASRAVGSWDHQTQTRR